MRSRRRRRRAWTGMMLLGLGCTPSVDEFECQESSECMAAGVEGSCEPNGYCSFPDEECSSGRRYGERAPEVIAGKCVEATGDTETDTGSGPATSTTTGPAASTNTSGSSSGADGSGSSDSSTASTTGEGSSSTGDVPPQGTPAEGSIALPLGATINAADAHPDGGLVIAGTTPLVQGDRELVLVHMDAQAQPAWAVTSDGVRNDQYFDVAVGSESIFATGLTRSVDLTGVVSNQLLVSEYTLDGDLVRHVVFASDDDHEGWGVTALGSGGIVVVGTTTGTDVADSDGLLMVLDADLEPVSTLRIGTPLRDRLRDVAESGDGYLVGGRLNNDVGLAQISAAGEVEWSTVLDAPGTGEIRDLAPLSDGSWIGVGEADALLADNVDGLLLGFDETGALRWFGNAITPRLDTCGGVVADEDGAWVMGTTQTADGTVQPWLARLVADAEPPSVQWTTGYPLDRVDDARGPAVARLADGGLGMAFATLGAAAPDGLAVLYTDSDGGVGDLCSATVVEPVDLQLDAAGPPLDPTAPTTAPLVLQRLELVDEIPTQALDPAASAEACD